jgi:hypothetical protein
MPAFNRLDLETLGSKSIDYVQKPRWRGRPRVESHLRSVGPCSSHAFFIVLSSCPYLRGNSSSLGTNVTVAGQNYKHSS